MLTFNVKLSMKLEEAFMKAYDTTGDKLYKHIYFRVSDKELAEDILQQTYFKAWRHLSENQRDFSHLRALFYKIAENLIIDHYRQKHKATVSTEDILELASDEDQLAKTDSIIQNEKVLAALEDLGEETKQIMLLKYTEGLSSKEISTITGKSVVNINVIVHRALKQLKANLNEKL